MFGCFFRHGGLDRRYGERAGALTDTMKHAVVAHLNNPLEQPYRIQRLMQCLQERFTDEEMPDENRVSKFVKNWKYRSNAPDREVGPEPQRARKYEFTFSDFQAAANSLPGLEDANSSMSLVHYSNDPSLQFIVTSPKILGILPQVDMIQNSRVSYMFHCHDIGVQVYAFAFADMRFGFCLQALCSTAS